MFVVILPEEYYTEVKTTLKVSIKVKFGNRKDNNFKLKSNLEIIFVRML